MVVHIYNPSERLRQEDYEFQTRLGYLERCCQGEMIEEKEGQERKGRIERSWKEGKERYFGEGRQEGEERNRREGKGRELPAPGVYPGSRA